MLSLYELKKILNPKQDSTPEDDFRIIQSWAEYDEKSSKPPEERNLKYLCYELEVMNPDTGEITHFYKAIKFARVIRLPANAKQSTAFMDMQEQIGFCAESVDIREEIRFEAILRMFIRVAIAQWLVSYNITIMKALFTSCGNLVGHLGQNQSVELSIDPAQAEVIKDLGFGTSIVFLILAVFLSLIVIICGFFLLYNVYFRFLKIMVIVPFGAIASSTLAGNRGLSNTFVAYMKYFISVVFEAVTMALAILLCNQFISSGLPTFTGDYEDWAKTLIYLGEMTFTVALTVGTVKGAQNLTSRALGL